MSRFTLKDLFLAIGFIAAAIGLGEALVQIRRRYMPGVVVLLCLSVGALLFFGVAFTWRRSSKATIIAALLFGAFILIAVWRFGLLN